MLAFFGGVFGAHRFYLGETGAGIFYVMLMIFFSMAKFPVTAILSFVDAIRMLMMSPRDFDRKYNAHLAGQANVPGQAPRQQRQQRRGARGRGRQQDILEERRRQSSRSTKARVNPYKATGIKKYKDFEIDEAIEDFNKGLEIEPRDVSLHFNLACAHSMVEDKDKSLFHLSQAIKYGFKDFEKIRTHDDLAFLRIQSEYEQFEENGFKLDAIKINKAQERGLLDDDVLLSQLNKLAELRKKGLLSDEEFAIEKKKLMRR